MNMQRLKTAFGAFSFVGLVVATVFFALSVTPSLLPRNSWTQGALSGFALAIGYGLGVLLEWIYRFFELREVPTNARPMTKLWVAIAVALLIIGFLWRMTEWQNSIRERMEMPVIETAYPIRIAVVAAVLGGILILMGRGFFLANRFIAGKLSLWMPRRVAGVFGFVLVSLLVLVLSNNVVLSNVLGATDRLFAKVDETFDSEVELEDLPSGIGDRDSVIEWSDIGKQGKRFLVDAPTREDLEQFWGKPVQQPLRVYAGLNSADDVTGRAEVALEELKRQGGFERSVLIVATPTGTGWLDPSAVDPLEYLHAGDTAIVSMQYSYLPSWITILVDPQRSVESSRALFQAVYGHWKTLPRDARPRLYLQGLSLGAYGGEMSAAWYTMLEDPIQGAVFSGTPFPSRQWQGLIASRNAGTAPWKPTIGDQRIVRFTTQENALDSGAPWGPLRVVYIQYASDPMVWFSPNLAWQRPEWLTEPRGPDVSPYLSWYPAITFLQVAFDLPMATAVPIGYGHNYAPSSYIDAWIAVTQPTDWDEAKTRRLKELLVQRETPKA